MSLVGTLLARPIRSGIDQVAQSGYPYVQGTYIPLEQLRTWTGMGISSESALNYVAVYQCVRALCNVFAQVPLKVYRRLDGEAREEATDHPLYDVLHRAPNPDMTSFVWRKILLRHVLTWGNHYSEIAHNAFGRLQLWPMRPDRVMPLYDDTGRKLYRYTDGRGGQTDYPAEKIFHVQGQTSDGLAGYSPIAELRKTLALSQSAETFGRNVFDNNARPATVLSHPAKLSQPAIDRLAGQMDALRGSGNAGRTVVLEEGTSITPVGFPPEDAEFLETRLLQHRLIYGAYGVPPHKVGDLERATFSNIEHQDIEWIKDGAMPWYVNAEQEFGLQLIDEDDVFAEFLVDGYLRGDAKSRAEALATRWQHGTLSPNEWRAKENENPIAGGDVYYAPVNYAPVAFATESSPEPESLPENVVPIESATRSADGIRCPNPECGRKVAIELTPPYRMTCPRCKTEIAEASPTRSTNGHDPDTTTALQAAFRSLIEPPVVNVTAPAVNVEPPAVNVDMGPVGDAIAEMTAAIERPRPPYEVVRDESGRITGARPVGG